MEVDTDAYFNSSWVNSLLADNDEGNKLFLYYIYANFFLSFHHYQSPSCYLNQTKS